MRLSPVLPVSLLVAGCTGHPVGALDPEQSAEAQHLWPPQPSYLDMLFVIDDSASMRQEQEALAANIPRFIEELENAPYGLPDLHLAVVSSDVGTGFAGGDGRCAGDGDAGQFQLPDGCPPLTDGSRYIRDVLLDERSGTRLRNYSGDLTAQLSCMAQVGTAGCGFEQPLEAMKRALEDPGNAGFLREGAFLALVFVTDEDDCSTTPEGRAMFDPAQDDREAPLGEYSSFRCFEFGTTCEPADERTPGPRTDCVPGDDDTAYMAPVADYVDFLARLKGGSGWVLPAAIMADRANADGLVVIGEDVSKDPPQLAVEPACVVCPDGSPGGCSLDADAPDGALVAAAPAIRLRSFLDGFERSTWQDICNFDPATGGVDLSGALLTIATYVKRLLFATCLRGRLALPLDCSVSDAPLDPTSAIGEQLIPPCDQAGPPCWTAYEDRAVCPDTDTGLIFAVNRAGQPPPVGTMLSVRCEVE